MQLKYITYFVCVLHTNKTNNNNNDNDNKCFFSSASKETLQNKIKIHKQLKHIKLFKKNLI